MSLDLSKTLDLIKLGLTDPAGAWQKYFAEETRWRDTAVILTAPVVIFNALLMAIFTSMFGAYGGLLPSGGFWGTLISSLVGASLGVFIASFIFSFLAGKLGGKSNFDKAFAALSLAWVPAFLGGVVSVVVPFVGALVALAAAVLSLVYLYRLLPLALELPDSKRVLHFILGLVMIVIVNVVIGGVLGLGGRDAELPRGAGDSYTGANKEPARASGMVGTMQRYGETIEMAGTHTYEPPVDGRLTKAQVKNYVDVQRKTRKVQERFQQKIQDMEESLEGQEKPGLAGLSAFGSTITGAMGAQNAEMEIVVTGGGNWAEHSWVKSQLQTAMLHGGEGAGAIVHNYKVYAPYMEELEQ